MSKDPATETLLDASSTCTTPPSYCCAILSAVCIRDVVAPPISRGCFIPRRFISLATCTISSNEGVINPLNPMMSALCLTASSRILSAPTITPRSTISYPLQPNTTPTIFFPISCTSPLTVASKILPAAEASSLAASMNGVRTATLFFMTRALFTTCGRNIFPTPNRSPTMFIPSINGPSMTSNGRG